MSPRQFKRNQYQNWGSFVDEWHVEYQCDLNLGSRSRHTRFVLCFLCFPKKYGLDTILAEQKDRWTNISIIPSLKLHNLIMFLLEKFHHLYLVLRGKTIKVQVYYTSLYNSLHVMLQYYLSLHGTCICGNELLIHKHYTPYSNNWLSVNLPMDNKIPTCGSVWISK